MTAPTQFGALPLPVPAPAAGAAPGDPALDETLAFSKAVLIASCGTAWAALAPLAGEVVRFESAHNPAEVSFNGKFLPALYAWRERGDLETLADDYDVEVSTLTLLWIFPAAQQGNQRIRRAFVNAVGKSLVAAVKRGRHPAWKRDGDPEEQAAWNGSFFWEWAGLWSIDRVSWRLQEVVIQNGDTEATYPAVQWDIAVKERIVDGFPDAPLQVEGQLGVPDGEGGLHITNPFLLEEP